jgi:hypothetical protein
MGNKGLLVLGGLAIVALVGVGWYLTGGLQAQPAAGAQNAVSPNAQTGAGAFAQGTMPDLGNLLSYNMVPGALSAPQATSVDPYSSNYGSFGSSFGNLLSILGNGKDGGGSNPDVIAPQQQYAL